MRLSGFCVGFASTRPEGVGTRCHSLEGVQAWVTTLVSQGSEGVESVFHMTRADSMALCGSTDVGRVLCRSR